MSQVCANGVGGKKRDEVEARRWLMLAARQDFDTAQLDLGTWMVEGRGGARDRKARLRLADAGGRTAAMSPRRTGVAKLYMQGHRHRARSGQRRRLVHPGPPRRAERSARWTTS